MMSRCFVCGMAKLKVHYGCTFTQGSLQSRSTRNHSEHISHTVEILNAREACIF